MWESLYVERSYLNTIGYSIGMNCWQKFEGEIDDNIVTMPKFDIQKATTRPSSFSRRYFCGPELVHRQVNRRNYAYHTYTSQPKKPNKEKKQMKYTIEVHMLLCTSLMDDGYSLQTIYETFEVCKGTD